jgi:hypothetical protein
MNQLMIRLFEMPYLFKAPVPGSPDWLTRTEIIYGGLVTDVPRRKVSPLDSRTKQQLMFGGMTGGDRMLHHGYAAIYATFLQPFLRCREPAVAEFGVLKGTGLAIWCDLFPHGHVLGFDIDPTHYEANKEELLRRGAFSVNSPEVFEFDQLSGDEEMLARILKGRTLDIVIDDGLHSVDAIVTTWRSVRPHLSSAFVYFIEDFANLLEQCGDEFEGYERRSFGMMTVIRGAPPEKS